MGRYAIGTSGWRYDRWRGDFYPSDLPRREELSYLAARVTGLELNASFYSLKSPQWYAQVRREVGGDVVLAVKGSRFISHMKRLKDPTPPLANFFASGVLALGDQLGPVLWQLPETLHFERERVEGFLEALPRTTTAAADLAGQHDGRVQDPLTAASVDLPIVHALEPRHASFGSEEALDLLRAHGIVLVRADSAGRWPEFDEDTGPLRYVRLHGHTRLYASGYSGASLDQWAERCEAWHRAGQEVHVYFDNDAEGRAPYDALSLLDRLGSRPLVR